MDHAIQEIQLVHKKTNKALFRKSIFLAWNHQCAYCDQPADTLDHVTPRMHGGLTVKHNLVPACRHCNGHKGSAPVWQWWNSQPFWDFGRALRVYYWIRG